MPLPQVNDRLKEIPAQALRTVFATIGQLLLVADRFRARAADQLSGSGEATATRPADQAPAPPPSAAKPSKQAKSSKQARPTAEPSRWRSLDKTGNVRLLDGDEEQDDEDVPRVAQAVPERAPAPVPSADYTPTEVVPAVPAEPAAAEAAAEPAPIDPALPEAAFPQAPAEPALPEAPAEATLPEAPAEPALPEAPAEAALPEAPGEALPVPHYDQLSVASLRARLRVLDASQIQTLLDYEKAHDSRPAVITLFERRLTKLDEGN
jgi:hypothetical protein